MNDLIAEVAWQIVYEMTPPGYDEQGIRLGHDERAAPARVIAMRRGMLRSWREVRPEVPGLEDWDVVHCALRLSFPSWIPGWWWAVMYPQFQLRYSHLGYEECAQRAREAAERR